MALVVQDDYRYDAFISYSHHPIVKPWVNQYFHPLLERWLALKLGRRSADVFIDRIGIKPGERWPARLRNALKVSKCLVPVFTGDYFSSPWCSCEWTSFIERENALGLDQLPESLIIPVIHDDGRWLPDRAKEYEPLDFSDCRTIMPKFEYHNDFRVLETKIEQLAEAVADVINNSPPYDPNWPIVEVKAIRPVKMQKLY